MKTTRVSSVCALEAEPTASNSSNAARNISVECLECQKGSNATLVLCSNESGEPVVDETNTFFQYLKKVDISRLHGKRQLTFDFCPSGRVVA